MKTKKRSSLEATVAGGALGALVLSACVGSIGDLDQAAGLPGEPAGAEAGGGSPREPSSPGAPGSPVAKPASPRPAAGPSTGAAGTAITSRFGMARALGVDVSTIGDAELCNEPVDLG
jgi:hypothetical protein